jgi:hypothetical protein
MDEVSSHVRFDLPLGKSAQKVHRGLETMMEGLCADSEESTSP